MHWRLSKYLVEETVKVIRRIFRYNSSWVNKDIEIVQFASGSEQLVFEQFFEENEKYPIVTVGSLGGTLQRAAFNDFVREVSDAGIVLGTRMQLGVEVTDAKFLKVQLPNAIAGENINALAVNYAWSGLRVGGGDIVVNLYRDYSTIPVLIASASLPGTLDRDFISNYAEFYPVGPLIGNDYWLTFQTTENDSYYFGIDTTVSTLYEYSLEGINMVATGSVAGSILFPPFFRIGGNYDANLVIKCMSKNSTAGAYDLSELISQYLMLLKYTQMNRLFTDSLKYISGIEDEVSFLVDRGIHIKEVRLGAIEMRRRGENDLIYMIPVTINIFSEWFQDYAVDRLREIDVSIDPFCWMTDNIVNKFEDL